jgi:hypothetical protein
MSADGDPMDVSDDSSPWKWRPPSGPWYLRLCRLISNWNPDPDLELDVPHIKGLLLDAAARKADWLLHPSVSALMRKSGSRGDLQLAVWSAQNLHSDLGKVELRESAWAWAPGGGMRLRPGAHDLSDVARNVRDSSYRSPIAIDPWARSMWVPFHQLWRDVPHPGPEDLQEFAGSTRTLLVALEYSREELPQILGWAEGRTRVVILLRRLHLEHASSSSAKDVPGAIFVTVHDEVQAIEAIVHESAHQHLFMYEVAAPLVDPHDTDLYRSPLRDDARPLRGLMLAHHALAYISAYYADALATPIAEAADLERKLDRARRMMLSAQDVILENRRRLTDAGVEFVEQTVMIGRCSA